MNPQRRLLVTGAGGFLGWTICPLAARDWQVWGTYHRQPLKIPHTQLLRVDLTDPDQVQACFDQVRPDAVLHLAALSRPNDCEQNPDYSYQVNVAASWRLADRCGALGIPLVFTSSELVFDGRNPPYTETSPVCPLNRYGEHKVLAELGMGDRYPAVTIARMPLMFGAASPQSESFLQPFLRQLRAGQRLQLFTDEIRMPVSATVAASGLLLLLNHPGELFNLGGRDRLSRYDFGQLLTDVFDLSPDLLSPCLQADIPMAAPRARDLTLDSSKAFALGYNPPEVRSQLAQLTSGSAQIW